MPQRTMEAHSFVMSSSACFTTNAFVSLAADGIESARRTCGGHGYSALSGLPRLFASYVQNVTWEGDNNVLYLQVSVLLGLCV